MDPFDPIPLDAIRDAQARLDPAVARIPLVRLNVEDAQGEIYLKLENLQPVGCFKLRGAGNAMSVMDRAALSSGVYTASAGNMAQGLAFAARRRGVACSVVVPDHAPRAKLDAIERLGARIVKVPFDEWWQVMLDHGFDGLSGKFIHPVSDANVMAGNGTIGLEILEDLPDVDAVIVPYGGGGLSGGIASAVKAVKPGVKMFASEVETAAPLAASLAAGRPVEVDYTPSFVDGIGGKSLMPEMWHLARDLLDGSLVVSLRQVADALRLLIERNRVVAEGAGASSVAAAISGKAGAGRIVCIISGGNIDAAKIAAILRGEIP